MTSALLFCLVVAIADGDTLTARCGEPGAYEQVKVRIAGIDSPEKSQQFGQRSRQALADLCHQEAATIKPSARDRYGRTLADVQCKGMDVGVAQVSAGMAWVFDKYSEGYEHLYLMQDAAKGAHQGLWTDLAPVAPWDWREQRRLRSQQSPSSLQAEEWCDGALCGACLRGQVPGGEATESNCN